MGRKSLDARASGAGPEPRRILVVGNDDWAVQQAAVAVAAGRHDVCHCHPIGDPAFPCNALVADRTCPLDAGFVAVLAVRAHGGTDVDAGELGAICGLRAGAPLVVAGMTAGNPLAPWAAAVVERDGHLAATIAAVITPPADVDLTQPRATTPVATS